MKLLPSRQGVLVESEQGQAFFRFWAAAAALSIYGIIAILGGRNAQLLIAVGCVSPGVAILEPGGRVSEALMAADMRMFEVKRVRKDRIRVQALEAANAR